MPEELERWGPRLRDTPLEYKWVLIKPEATETGGSGRGGRERGIGVLPPLPSSDCRVDRIERWRHRGGREFDQLEIGLLLAWEK